MALENKKIGQRIQNIRNRRGLSQDELAVKANTSRKHISLVETGNRGPSVDLLVDLANALEVSVDDILADALSERNTDEGAEMRMILLECTKEEERFLIENAKAVKELLRKFGI